MWTVQSKLLNCQVTPALGVSPLISEDTANILGGENPKQIQPRDYFLSHQGTEFAILLESVPVKTIELVLS